MSRRPHVVVLHRWHDRYALYDRYLDHEQYTVSYLTTAVGVAGVPDAGQVALVDATDDVAQVHTQILRLAQRHGPPQAVVALKEDDLLTAAELAQRWRCPGRTPAQLAPFRDKLLMARVVAAAGVPVPDTAPAPDAGAVLAHGIRHGWPVVVKPRIGSSSQGVRLIGPGDVTGLPYDGFASLLVQARNDDPIHHVDGVFDGARLGPWRLSRYVDTCLNFRDGRPLGSVGQDDPAVLDPVEEFTTTVLRALTDQPTVFHLELFLGRADDGSPRCTFLEVGARVGGAEIPFVWRDVHSYDLMDAAFRIALGQAPEAAPAPGRRPVEVAGWLLVPAPAERPCRIVQATSMLGRVPGPYAEVVPRTGDVLPAADAYYEHVGARFRFRGPDTAAVLAAVQATARDARVTGQACADPVAGGVR